MNNELPELQTSDPAAASASRQPERLLTGADVKVCLTSRDTDCGRGFTEAEWNRIAERLSALARLLWRISRRELQKESDQKNPASCDAKSGKELEARSHHGCAREGETRRVTQERSV